jgi:putative ABC transport system ATP-binding protein
MESVCELERVGKRYGDRVVLDNFSLAVGAGEMIAITGKSGSGKTTLLNIIGLLERPYSGRVALFGSPAPRVGSRTATQLLRSRIGYLFQNFALIDDATVGQNLDVALLYDRRSRKEQEALKLAALDRVGLPAPLSKKVYTLSGGEQQRLAIARLLLKPCDLILADEPTGSLDPTNRDAILAILHQFRQEGKTIIISSHDPIIAGECGRVIALEAESQIPSDSVR